MNEGNSIMIAALIGFLVTLTMLHVLDNTPDSAATTTITAPEQ
jgi:hypothetical protein